MKVPDEVVKWLMGIGQILIIGCVTWFFNMTNDHEKRIIVMETQYASISEKLVDIKRSIWRLSNQGFVYKAEFDDVKARKERSEAVQ